MPDVTGPSGGLEQSDILSDGEPFDGTNIDAAISSRATPGDTGDGVDWASKTPKVSGGTTFGSVAVSVSGSGYLFDIRVITPQRNAETEISIDGSVIYDTASDPRLLFNTGGPTGGMPDYASNIRQQSGIFRFDSSFVIEENSGRNIGAIASYVLD